MINILNFSKKNKLIKSNKKYKYIKLTDSETNIKLINATKHIEHKVNPLLIKGLIITISAVIIIISFFTLKTILKNYKNGSFNFSLYSSDTDSDKKDVNSDNKTDNENNTLDKRLLTLINSKNPVDESFILPELVTYDGVEVSKDLLSDLTAMINDAKKDGISIKATEGYVSSEVQQKIYDNTIEYYINEKHYSSVKAEATTMRDIAKGKESEKQTGLLISFSGDNEDFTKSSAYGWLMKNCVKYGFVLRYPENKKNITGMNGKADIFRYVGIDNAKRMRSLNMCLEEYVSYLLKQ